MIFAHNGCYKGLETQSNQYFQHLSSWEVRWKILHVEAFSTQSIVLPQTSPMDVVSSLKIFLRSLDLTDSVVNSSLFLLIYLFVYVDDIVVTSLDDALVWTIIENLGKNSPFASLGNSDFF